MDNPRIRIARRTGQPDRRHLRTGPRPEAWKHGPDPVRQAQQRAYSVMRCQARYRGEPFHLTFRQYVRLWTPHWSRRGRGPFAVNLTRVNPRGPWAVGNCRMIARSQVQAHAHQFVK